jgi:hypothetical protein
MPQAASYAVMENITIFGAMAIAIGPMANANTGSLLNSMPSSRRQFSRQLSQSARLA